MISHYPILVLNGILDWESKRQNKRTSYFYNHNLDKGIKQIAPHFKEMSNTGSGIINIDISIEI